MSLLLSPLSEHLQGSFEFLPGKQETGSIPKSLVITSLEGHGYSFPDASRRDLAKSRMACLPSLEVCMVTSTDVHCPSQRATPDVEELSDFTYSPSASCSTSNTVSRNAIEGKNSLEPATEAVNSVLLLSETVPNNSASDDTDQLVNTHLMVAEILSGTESESALATQAQDWFPNMMTNNTDSGRSTSRVLENGLNIRTSAEDGADELNHGLLQLPEFGIDHSVARNRTPIQGQDALLSTEMDNGEAITYDSHIVVDTHGESLAELHERLELIQKFAEESPGRCECDSRATRLDVADILTWSAEDENTSRMITVAEWTISKPEEFRTTLFECDEYDTDLTIVDPITTDISVPTPVAAEIEVEHAENAPELVVRQLEVPGWLGHLHVLAVPDFGSSFNIASEDVASSLKLTINTADAREFGLPNGGRGSFLGTIEVSWSFSGEEHRPWTRVFHILKNCVHPVMLGRDFLKETQTLSKNVHRIQEKFLKCLNLPRKLLFVDTPAERATSRERILGLINGHPIGGLADTCSDLTIIKRCTAEQLGLTILEGEEHTTEVQFVDGSTAHTTGIIRDARWCFSATLADDDMHTVDLHVMDDIPCAFILNTWLLWDNRAFVEYQDSIIDIVHCNITAQDPVCLITEKRRLKLLEVTRNIFTPTATHGQYTYPRLLWQHALTSVQLLSIHPTNPSISLRSKKRNSAAQHGIASQQHRPVNAMPHSARKTRESVYGKPTTQHLSGLATSSRLPAQLPLLQTALPKPPKPPAHPPPPQLLPAALRSCLI